MRKCFAPFLKQPVPDGKRFLPIIEGFVPVGKLFVPLLKLLVPDATIHVPVLKWLVGWSFEGLFLMVNIVPQCEFCPDSKSYVPDINGFSMTVNAMCDC